MQPDTKAIKNPRNENRNPRRTAPSFVSGVVEADWSPALGGAEPNPLDPAPSGHVSIAIDANWQQLSRENAKKKWNRRVREGGGGGRGRGRGQTERDQHPFKLRTESSVKLLLRCCDDAT